MDQFVILSFAFRCRRCNLPKPAVKSKIKVAITGHVDPISGTISAVIKKKKKNPYWLEFDGYSK